MGKGARLDVRTGGRAPDSKTGRGYERGLASRPGSSNRNPGGRGSGSGFGNGNGPGNANSFGPGSPDDGSEHGFTISRFAELAGTTRDTLLYYDRIGLLHPAVRGENNYRYYSERELTKAKLIRTFQSLGLSLQDIQALLQRRSPSSVLDSITEQMEEIAAEQTRLEQTRLMLETFHSIIDYALNLEEGTIVLRRNKGLAILLGPSIDRTKAKTFQEGIHEARRHFQEVVPPSEMSYPIWGIYERESIEKRRWELPDRFYMANPNGRDERAAGWYVIGTTRGGLNASQGLLKRLCAYIEGKGLELKGPAYVDYLLDEVCVKDADKHLIHISIAVAGPAS
jgi:DNA-binding transcriptional MerR regulator